MKNGWREVVGRKIEGVIVGASTQTPRHQVFLLFDDGTTFEIYGDAVTCASGVLHRSDPERAIDPRYGNVVAVYWTGGRPTSPRPLQLDGDERAPYHVPAAETADVQTEAALRAWETAKASIEKARKA